jgi:hypothetical protein
MAGRISPPAGSALAAIEDAHHLQNEQLWQKPVEK